jgi:hypothetical protein
MRSDFPGFERFSQLKNKSGLIVCRTPAFRKLIGEMLMNLGLSANSFLTESETAILELRYGTNFMFVMGEATAEHGDHLLLAKFIRWDDLSATPKLPLIAFGAKWTVQSIAEARDSGINGIIALPCTTHSFLRRFVDAVCNPAPFVCGQTYRGPDRRLSGSEAYKGPRRRQQDKSSQAGAMAQAELMRNLKKRDP